MVILMDTIAIAGGVHSVSLYEQTLLEERFRPVKPARLREALSAGLFRLGGGLQRLSRRLCDECQVSVTLHNDEAKTA